jgi:hypothetical protein
MSALAAPTFMYHRQVRGLSLEELQEAYEDLVTRVID